MSTVTLVSSVRINAATVQSVSFRTDEATKCVVCKTAGQPTFRVVYDQVSKLFSVAEAGNRIRPSRTPARAFAKGVWALWN